VNLAIVVPRWSLKIAGGAERLAREYAEMLRDRHQVEILTTCALDHVSWKNELAPGTVEEGGLLIRRFPTDSRDSERYHELQLRLANGERLLPSEELEWQRNGVTSQKLNRFIEKSNYDLLFGMPFFFGVVQQALSVSSAKKILVPCLHPEPQAELGIIRKLFGAVDAVCFNAPEERALAATLYRLPTWRPVISMGMSPSTGAGVSPILGPYLLYLGRKEAGKGTHQLAAYFLRYCQQFPNSGLRLVVAGGGELPAWPQLQDRIIDFSWVDEAEKGELINGALALVQPCEFESLSIVTLEAWSYGRPVLVNGRSAVQRGNVLRSHGGLTYDDEKTFIRSLRWLEENPGEADLYGVAGSTYLRCYHDPKVMQERLLRTVAEISDAVIVN